MRSRFQRLCLSSIFLHCYYAHPKPIPLSIRANDRFGTLSKRANNCFQHLYLSPIFLRRYYAHAQPNALKSNGPFSALVPLLHLPSLLLRPPRADSALNQSKGPFSALVPLPHPL
ncbi:hypothetical protein C8R41DRAFT_179131 [Lentinula lateritia]|uniref:Secreted protein n=1 Tax=Lentinula lateritia TaxID=40482 RepID=A0ABQ8VQ50_9AGAR|nr:hypothetical protein C8R41DRAFT_179131 [Lentinula lateritia]